MAHASYTAQIVEYPAATRPNSSPDRTVLVITDLNRPKARSVTNDIETVLAECLQTYGRDLPRRVIYSDSEGMWDGVSHTDGTFRDFYPIRETELDKAIARAFGRAAPDPG